MRHQQTYSPLREGSHSCFVLNNNRKLCTPETCGLSKRGIVAHLRSHCWVNARWQSDWDLKSELTCQTLQYGRVEWSRWRQNRSVVYFNRHHQYGIREMDWCPMFEHSQKLVALVSSGKPCRIGGGRELWSHLSDLFDLLYCSASWGQGQTRSLPWLSFP
jgi:hypothetical protein